jgi:polygalacturonase
MSLLILGFFVLASAKQCDITKYGASTTRSDNTKAIQQAINDCISGGEVLVPAGKPFLTYPLLVENGVRFTLTIAKGATLRAGPRSGWPLRSSTNYLDFLRFANCSTCSLQGKGLIDGQGTPWYIAFDKGEIKPRRPDFISVQGGSNFRLLDVTLLNSPMFNVVTSKLHGGEIARINITNEWYDNGSKEPHNTDGIDPGGNSRDIHIHDCHIHNGDDSVAIKPGTVAGGCTRNILVENSYFEKGHGCSIGSVGEVLHLLCTHSGTVLYTVLTTHCTPYTVLTPAPYSL